MKFNELDQKIKDGTLTENEIKTFADNSREYLNTISSLIDLEESVVTKMTENPENLTEDDLNSHKVLFDSISNIEDYCLKNL
jgi:uncharacterized protein YnzC (UPF0291/DUF896 family)